MGENCRDMGENCRDLGENCREIGRKLPSKIGEILTTLLINAKNLRVMRIF